ncbi:hypothetical protein GHK33_19300 [Sinorhizobium meliloti]|uniref:Uncharacterized protein n=1 Tax=Rhizobium meliloti TaxID=382 RepID=A0A6A7ZHV0_RHIML|nr:hypothetical protein [Sinorhizobium meliloti]MDW9490818.1 hypothetical protein [Sinorhizobium meliloti]MDW9559342.1 hypothetical protein [Sinorhizobium meliloti]MDW9646617.1 hypothetical protein [Sinorhizobium meliloti]MDW9810385.1 hypothetical protein [Sinorhizobium meliloti]
MSFCWLSRAGPARSAPRNPSTKCLGSPATPLSRLVDLLIPVLVIGIQPEQVLGLKEHSPRRRRGAAGSL